jgi:DDE superfamily endonuclease
MPRNSVRKQVIDKLELLITAAIKRCIQLKLFGLPTDKEEDFLFRCRSARQQLLNNRYLTRGPYRKKEPKFERFLVMDGPEALNDVEFRFHFRMSRSNFWEIVELLKDHEAFSRKGSDSRGPAPQCAAYQLLVLLKYYGCEGNQAASKALSTFFGIGIGVVDSYRNNALSALLSLESSTYIWPDEEERASIANRIQANYKFPNCVGFIDGTLLPLSARPLLHGENYLSRKKFYAVVMLIVCDEQSRVLYYHIGWPGSVHDNRVWRNCAMQKHPSRFFSKKQYLLGDSAFTASNIMIPPFKTHGGGSLSNNKTAFNTLLAKPRVKSEHCIGILKGRFPFLRNIRLKIATKEDMHRLIDYVRGTVILHNFLRNENVQEWIDMIEEVLDDLEPEAGTATNQANYARRDELFYYLSELQDTVIN